MSKANTNDFPVGITCLHQNFVSSTAEFGCMVYGSWLPFPAGVVFLAEVYEVDKPGRADP